MAQLVMTAGRAGLSALQAAGPALANAAATIAVNALIGGPRREGPRHALALIRSVLRTHSPRPFAGEPQQPLG
jgi:hypothetical protein